MAETYSPNDIVYVEHIGFCQLISCGRHKTLKFKKKPIHDELDKPLYLVKQKESLYFEPDTFLFEEASLIVVPPETIPIALPDALPEPELSSRKNSRIQETSHEAEAVNIVTLKLYKSEYLVHTPDSNLSQHIQLRVKTMFCNREEFTFYININSTILQLKNKIIELSKEPLNNLDNVRLISANGFIHEFANNKEFIYQTKITHICKLLLLANVRFSIDPTHKGDNVTLSNNNRTVAKAAQDGKYELCLGNSRSTQPLFRSPTAKYTSKQK